MRVRNALRGEVGPAIVGALRRAGARAAAAGEEAHAADVHVNLGVALMRMGNGAPGPAEYRRLYRESEAALAAALALRPGHAGAAANLERVRANARIRAGLDGAPA